MVLYDKCLRCGRALTAKASMATGFGDTCRKKLGQTLLDTRKGLHFLDFAGSDVFLVRIESIPKANVQVSADRHGTTDIDWGREGKATRNLAYHILRKIGCSIGEAQVLEEPFYMHVLLHVPRQGGQISAAEIWRWMIANRSGVKNPLPPRIDALPELLESHLEGLIP